MTDKVKFSSYFREHFKEKLISLSKNKLKADNIYHSKYISINNYLNSFNNSTLDALCIKLASHQYRCESLTPIILPKTNCLSKSSMTVENSRLVCVPSVQDRVLQRLFIQYLKAYYKKVYAKFCEFDHALNKDITNKSIEIFDKNGQLSTKTIYGIRKALDDVIEYRNKYKYVIKADVVKFFDNINREIAVNKFEKEFLGLKEDKELVAIFKSFVYCDAKLEYGDQKYEKLIKTYLNQLDGKGVRQGMPIASLCSSMYLHEFDNLIVNKNIPYIRYADDFLIFSNSYDEAKQLKQRVQTKLKGIGLSIEKKYGKQKTEIFGYKQRFSYLGFDIAYSSKLNTYQRHIPKPVFDRAIGRIYSFDSITKVKREFGHRADYLVFTNYLNSLISGYTNFYSEELAVNGKKFNRDLNTASKLVRKKLISDNLNIDFEKIGSNSKKMFFFGVK